MLEQDGFYTQKRPFRSNKVSTLYGQLNVQFDQFFIEMIPLRLSWSICSISSKFIQENSFSHFVLVTQEYIDPDSLLRSFLLCLWTWAWKLSKITLHLCGSHYISITRHLKFWSFKLTQHDFCLKLHLVLAQFRSWKKPRYAKIGLYCMIQLVRKSSANDYIRKKLR